MEVLEKFAELLGYIVLMIIVVAGLAFIFAFPTMWLWNWLMPDLFGLHTIDFWHALGINVFTGLLFRGTHSTLPTKKK